MDSRDHIATYVPPFELFSMIISHTHDNNKVSTRTLGLSTTSCYVSSLLSSSPNRHQTLLISSFPLVA